MQSHIEGLMSEQEDSRWCEKRKCEIMHYGIKNN